MYYEGVCANAGPHSQKLHGRVTNICRNRMRQQCRSAMAPPQHEPTSCQIDVVSSRQVSMSLQASEAVLYLENMLAFACSQATLVEVIPFLYETMPIVEILNLKLSGIKC